jgi:hypothetical protein
MKKFFEDAELEIVKFNNADVITTSDESLPDKPDPGEELPGEEW